MRRGRYKREGKQIEGQLKLKDWENDPFLFLDS